MSNRFDDMFVQGINTSDATATAGDILQGQTAYARGQKITGSLVPSTGGDLNVFVQTTEPQSKDGIWIKDNTSVSATKCLFENAPIGEFLDPSQVSYLYTNQNCIGQVIVNGYLYSFGFAGQSYKFNLKDKTQTAINSATVPEGIQPFGACYYDGLIYVFAKISGNIQYFTYDPELNSSSGITNTGCSCSQAGHTNVHVFNDKAYMAGVDAYSNNSAMFEFNFATGTCLSIGGFTAGGSAGCCFGHFGGYMYYTQAYSSTSDGIIYRYDIANRSSSQIANISSYTTKRLAVYATANYLFIFEANGNDTYKYYKYDLNDNSVEEVSTEFKYNMYNRHGYSGSSAQYGTYDMMILDEQTGLLYFREHIKPYSSSYAGYTDMKNPSVMKLEDPSGSLAFDNGTAVLEISSSSRFVKLQNDSNLYTGVQNTYIYNNDEFNSNHMAYYGDGEKWTVFKNPNNETVTVTFNLDGGSGNVPSQTIIAGTTATEPSTNPTKSGEVFEGWYVGNKRFDFSEKVSLDTTLTAHYLSYEEVDYIQSTGTQYIDTGYKVNQDTEIVADGCLMSNNYLFGVGSNGQYVSCGILNASDTYKARWRSSANANADVSSSVSTGSTRHTFTVNKTSFSIDGTVIGNFNSTYTFTENYNLYLFCWNTLGSSALYSTSRIYNFKIYDNNTLVRDFQPIQLTGSGEFCLLDKVNHRLYGNMGTGQFIGDGYEPTYLDYIQSSGTQYIDTGVYPYKTKVEATFSMASQPSSTCYLIGCYNTNDNRFDPLVYRSNNSDFATGDRLNNYTSLGSYNTSKHTIIYNDENHNVYYDTVQKATVSDLTTQVSNPIYLFARRGTSSAESYVSGCRMYEIKITDKSNNTLIRNFVPALDFNNVACLWDKVSETFFYNAGTGTFSYGEVSS